MAKLGPRRRSIGPGRLGAGPASGGSPRHHRLEKYWPQAHRRRRSQRWRPGARASATPSRLRAPSPAPCLPREVKARTNDGLECNLYSQNSGGLSLHTYTWNLHSATDCVLNFEKNATARAAGQKCNVQLLLLLRRRDTSETPRQMPTIQSTGSMSASVEAASTSAAARSGRRLALGLGGPSPSARAWCVERLRMHSFGRSSERHDRSSRVRSATLEPTAPAPRGRHRGGELRRHQASTYHRRHVPAPLPCGSACRSTCS